MAVAPLTIDTARAGRVLLDAPAGTLTLDWPEADSVLDACIGELHWTTAPSDSGQTAVLLQQTPAGWAVRTNVEVCALQYRAPARQQVAEDDIDASLLAPQQDTPAWVSAHLPMTSNEPVPEADESAPPSPVSWQGDESDEPESDEPVSEPERGEGEDE